MKNEIRSTLVARRISELINHTIHLEENGEWNPYWCKVLEVNQETETVVVEYHDFIDTINAKDITNFVQ